MANVNLTWKAPSTGEIPDFYQLYRTSGTLTGTQNADGFGTVAANLGADPGVLTPTASGTNPEISAWQVTLANHALGDDISFTDSNASAATTYNYCVKSAKGSGISALESTAHANSTDGDTGVVYTITTA
jgi:hypothetical protein